MRVPYNSSSTQINIFLKNLNEYLDSGTYCDLTFNIGCEQFPCHRIILASASPYFQALLSHAFKENDLNSIELHDIEPQIFSSLLHYIYSGQIELDENNVHDLLIAGDMFQLDEIVKFCCHYLSISLHEQNVLDTWTIANKLQCLSLIEDAEHYILTNFRSLIVLDLIKLFPKELLEKMISHDDLIVNNEQQVFEAILIWYIKNNHIQKSEDLFDYIRFRYISKEHQNMTLNHIGSEYPLIIPYIEQIILNREYTMNSLPSRRSVRQTCYIFGGYGSDIDDSTTHLLTTSYRCHFNPNDNWDLFTLEIKQIHGDKMHYPRMHHQIASLGSLVYIVGGEDGDNIYNSVEIFDPITKLNSKQWIHTGSMVTPRCNFGLVALDSRTLLALGGHIGADITSTIETFNSDIGSWTLLPYQLKSPSYGFACVQWNGLIFCIGGSCIFNLPARTMEVFNPNTGISYLCTDLHVARSFCSACLDEEGEKIYVFGGADAHGNGLHSAEVYDPHQCRWTMLPPMVFNRISPCVYRIRCFIFVFGGRTSLELNSEILNTAEIYNITKNSWTRTNDLPIRIYGAATVLH